MMNARRTLSLLALAALIAVLAIPAHGQTGIIVNNADTIRQEGVRLDSGLSGVTSSVGLRIILQYANTMRQERVAAPPGALQTLFAQVPARIVLQYANTMRQERIAAPPAGLQTLFGQVAPRIILQYANTSRQMTLAYPVALIGDTVPPQIRDVQTQFVAGGVKVTWTTDEFATSEVRYGTASGVYTQTASDPLYEKAHALTLTGLTPGTRYYFVVAGADLSGNRAQSGEYQVVVPVPPNATPTVTPTPTPTVTRTPTMTPVVCRIYLPLTLKSPPQPTPTPTVHPDVCQRYEPNNTLSTAWGPLPRNQAIQAALCSGDPDDYYYLDLTAAATLTLDLTNLPAGTDYELVLYNAGGSRIAESRNGGTTPERIVRSLGVGRYYVRVYPYYGRSSQPYRLIALW